MHIYMERVEPVKKQTKKCTAEKGAAIFSIRITNVRANHYKARDSGEVVRGKSQKSTEQSAQSKGTKTRDAILQKSARLASAEGLGAITIGRLAGELGMTKSGLFAHF